MLAQDTYAFVTSLWGPYVMVTVNTQLQAMRHLGENWDGYGAAAPGEHIIDLASGFVNLVEAVLRQRLAMPGVVHVSPTRTGGILVEWEDATMQHEVEINPDHS